MFTPDPPSITNSAQFRPPPAEDVEACDIFPSSDFFLPGIPGWRQFLPTPEEIEHDSIDYSEVTTVDGIDYRAVELPMCLCDRLPRRNFTEEEWRCLGVVMSKGWENHGRRIEEPNVLLFRRAKYNKKKLDDLQHTEISDFLSSTSPEDKFPSIAIIPVGVIEKMKLPDPDLVRLQSFCSKDALRSTRSRVLIALYEWAKNKRIPS